MSMSRVEKAGLQSGINQGKKEGSVLQRFLLTNENKEVVTLIGTF